MTRKQLSVFRAYLNIVLNDNLCKLCYAAV